MSLGPEACPRDGRKGADKNYVDYERLFDSLLDGITLDIDLLASQLHAEKEKLYEKYDKNKTESDFRAAVILPLLFVAVILMYRLHTEAHPVFAILIAAFSWLVAAGLAGGAKERLQEANEVVLNSLIAGNIKSSRLLVFEQPPPPKPEEAET